MELGEVGWGGHHQEEADLGSNRNNLELNIVTEQPRKREEEEEQESSLESQPDFQSQKLDMEEQTSIEERSSPTFGFEKNFLRLRRVSAAASTGYNERRNRDDEEAGDEEDGQDDDNSLDSGFQESRLQDLEAQMKRSSQLSRISFDKDANSPKKSSESSRGVIEAEMDELESVKKSSQSSRLSHVLWSKGSSDTDDEGEKETKANRETAKEAGKNKSSISQDEEIEKRKRDYKEDESNSNMEKAEERIMGKVGFNKDFTCKSSVISG